MGKRIELRIDDETKDELEKYRIENHFEDLQDAIRDILKKRLFKINQNKDCGFFKNLFSYFRK